MAETPLFRALPKIRARTVSLRGSALHSGDRARSAVLCGPHALAGIPRVAGGPALLSQRRHGAYHSRRGFQGRGRSGGTGGISVTRRNPAPASNYATSVFQEGCRPRRTQFEKNHWLRGGKSRAVTVEILQLSTVVFARISHLTF